AVDEGEAEHVGHLAPDHRLAGAHQPDEDDAAPPESREKGGRVGNLGDPRCRHGAWFRHEKRCASSGPARRPGSLALPGHLFHKTCQRAGPRDMPTLFRLLTTIAVLAGLVYAAMFALATFVEPNRTEMTVEVPTERLLQR